MATLERHLRTLARRIRSTPFHPQWLLEGRAELSNVLIECSEGVVLDIGCADRWAQQYLPAGCAYVGVDSVATGGLLYGARPNLFADAHRLPLAASSVDHVLLFEVIEHLRNPEIALAEIARVLRPGGRLLMTVPFLYPVHDAPHDYQRYTEHGLKRDLIAAGFQVTELRTGLGSAETAGLLTCLALAGGAIESVKARRLSMLLMPLLLAMIPVTNLSCWLLGKILPSWSAITAGYSLVAIRNAK